MPHNKKQYALVTFLALGWFLVLPMPFDKVSDITQRQWHWMGGYHATVEGFIKTSPSETVAYMNQYHYESYWLLFLSIGALVAAFISFAACKKISDTSKKV